MWTNGSFPPGFLPSMSTGLTRRSFVSYGAAGLSAGLITSLLGASRALADRVGATVAPPKPFTFDTLIAEARALAATAYAPKPLMPQGLADISYDEYRTLRFRKDRAVWGDADSPFRMDLFAPGFFYRKPVRIHVVEGGQSVELAFNADHFEDGDRLLRPRAPGGDDDLTYAGFRVRHPINNGGIWDEFLVFLGASYFRAVGAGEVYGLSARGLALATGEPQGEEFPDFIAFYIEKPAPGARGLGICALLDSPSVTGAYSLFVEPGQDTMISVRAHLFPRTEIRHVGIAPLTSMFLFDHGQRTRVDDFRPAVHDSDGLLIERASGERLWRALANPRSLQVSALQDGDCRGFGLVQRKRAFEDYQDLEAHYQRRPSAWIEPIGSWGPGHVLLFEIPTEFEYHDNVVAFWRPERPLMAGEPYQISYRISFCDLPPSRDTLAPVEATRAGLNINHNQRLFIIDFAQSAALNGRGPEQIAIDVGASAGTISNITGVVNAETGGFRASFEFDPGNAALSELRLILRSADQPISETWLYRWSR